MLTVLSIYNKGHTLQRAEDITLIRVISIGRHKYNSIHLSDSKVSRFHAALFREDEGKYFLQDLGSKNGLLINGEPCDYGYVRIGDTIEIGDFTLTLQTQASKAKQKKQRITISDDVSCSTSKTSSFPVSNRIHNIEQLILDRDLLYSLYRISHLVNISSDLHESLDAIIHELHKALTPGRIMVAELENNGEALNCLALSSKSDNQLKISRTMLKNLAENKQIIMTEDAVSDDNFKVNGRAAMSVIDLKMKAVVCIPLKWAGEIKGILFMDSFEDKSVFTDKGLQLLALIGEELSALMERNRIYSSIQDQKNHFEKMLDTRDLVVGNTPAMKDILIKASRIAMTDVTVLITGETGTGKGNLANLIHRSSSRKDKPFVEINCSAIPESLLESELFGHKKGSFTNALEDRIGKLVSANGGTVFLDEIGDLSLAHQAKLLKVIEGKNICPIGTNISVPVDIRIIAATNMDIEKNIQAGKFRQDLYARFTFPIHIPPLRERQEDTPLLAGYFLKIFRPLYNPAVKKLSNKSVDLLMAYDWPNNIRELQSLMIRALIEIPPHQSVLTPDIIQPRAHVKEFKKLDEIEKEYMLRVLKHTNCNKEKAARILGIAKQTLYNKWHDYNLGAILDDECSSRK